MTTLTGSYWTQLAVSLLGQRYQIYAGDDKTDYWHTNLLFLSNAFSRATHSIGYPCDPFCITLHHQTGKQYIQTRKILFLFPFHS